MLQSHRRMHIRGCCAKLASSLVRTEKMAMIEAMMPSPARAGGAMTIVIASAVFNPKRTAAAADSAIAARIDP